MGNLFFRGVSPTEIEAMSFGRARYWNTWHEIMIDAEREEMAKKGASGKQPRKPRKPRKVTRRRG